MEERESHSPVTHLEIIISTNQFDLEKGFVYSHLKSRSFFHPLPSSSLPEDSSHPLLVQLDLSVQINYIKQHLASRTTPSHSEIEPGSEYK